MAVIPLFQPADITEDTVDFDLADFRLALFQKGRTLIWDQAMSCPCQTQVETNKRGTKTLISEPRPECPGCGGSGIIYASRQETVGMLTDAMFDQKFFNLFGRYAEGSVFITLLPEHMPAPGDRFTLKRGIRVYEETGFTHRLTVERPRYPIVKRKMLVGEAGNPTQPEVMELGVLNCRAADLDGVLLSTVYREGEHFTITENGELDWTLAEDADTAPPIGGRLSIRYYGRPCYTVQSLPYAQRDLHQNDINDVYERYLGLHPVKVVATPEFFGARNPPVVADVTGDEARPSED